MNETEVAKEDIVEGHSKHRLELIHPDSWNNIPICIVDGIKHLTESCLETISQLKDLKKQVGDNEKRQKHNNTSFAMQISNSDNNLKRKLADLERLSRKMSTDAMTLAKDKTDKLESAQKNMLNSVNQMVNEIDDKLHKINETEQIMALVKDEISKETNTTVAAMIAAAKTELEQYVETKFTVPGIIGPEAN
jgi:ABC-type transporter Mla subunit MlaD